MKILAFSLSQFYDAAKTAKKGFTQADRALGIKQFYKQGHNNCHRCSQRLRTNEAKNWQKIKNSQPLLKIY